MSYLPSVIVEGLSLERFGPYRRAAVGDSDGAALQFYEWNARISGSFWIDIGYLEIFLRNTLHRQLVAWSEQTYGEPAWYLDPGRVLTPRHRSDIVEARRRATTGARAKPESPGRIIAELSFGFWRFLLAKGYDDVLWVPTLRHGFPNLMGHGRREDVHRALVKLHILRNRIAHHEPIHTEKLSSLHRELLTTLHWINPHYRSWVATYSTVQTILKARPVAAQ